MVLPWERGNEIWLTGGSFPTEVQVWGPQNNVCIFQQVPINRQMSKISGDIQVTSLHLQHDEN